MDKSRNVRFDLLVPHFFESDEDNAMHEKHLDMAPLLAEISKMSHREKTYDIGGDKFQIYRCINDTVNSCWEIQLLRLRDKDLPAVSTEDGEYQNITIRDDQFVAESSTILYDTTNYELYMQRNMHCITPNALARYIDMFMPNGSFVQMVPQITKDGIERMKSRSAYRMLSYTVGDMLGEDVNDADGFLLSTLKSLTDYFRGDQIRIEIGFGRKRGYLNRGNAYAAAEVALSDPRTKALKVRVGDAEDYEENCIDLLHERVSFFANLLYSRQNPVTHERLYAECLRQFIAKKLN